MKLKKQLLAGLVAATLVPMSASAAFLTNWTLDVTGAGRTTGDGVSNVGEYLDMLGTSYIDIGPTFTTFNDYGTFEVAGADGVGSKFDNFVTGGDLYELTAIFSLSGTVALPGAISFTPYAAGEYAEMWIGSDSTGTADYGTAAGIYGANNGVKIGTFQLSQGSGAVDVTGVPNGQITLILEPTFLAAGYFKDSSGNDLATMVTATQGDGPLFGFVTTNASLIDAVPGLVNSEIVMELAGGASLANSAPPDRFVVSNNGQYRWAPAAIPEPATLGLLGIGLLGMGFASRKRKA